ncbi:hypothetical protein GCHA_4725 [Paraglaciecola chathamensis S18K6]|uniref:Uncharacterized protein n=1 Tax=Paraglaciecola chathamensis S18K6 TaxID=1127672 RepID=A0AAV3V7V7_9ALTE|nr:hypothetical protein GCHA_4725 [Paraglaciecola chathamensis S18K6]
MTIIKLLIQSCSQAPFENGMFCQQRKLAIVFRLKFRVDFTFSKC